MSIRHLVTILTAYRAFRHAAAVADARCLAWTDAGYLETGPEARAFDVAERAAATLHRRWLAANGETVNRRAR